MAERGSSLSGLSQFRRRADRAGAADPDLELCGARAGPAGDGAAAPIDKTTNEIWEHSIAINLTAPFQYLRAAVPAMVSTVKTICPPSNAWMQSVVPLNGIGVHFKFSLAATSSTNK